MVGFRSRAGAIAVASALALSACSGGAGSVGSATVTRDTGGLSRGSVVMAFALGAHGDVSRRRDFLSPSTGSVSIAVSGVSTPVVADVSPTSPLCATTAAGRSCTISVAAPVGTDTFAATLYAAAGATGAVLGTGTASVAVTSGTAFTAAIGIAGVANSIALSLSTLQFTAGTAGTATVTVQALDAGGNIISGTYAQPITLTNSDTSGAFTLSPSSVASSSTAVTLAYKGTASATSDTISASAANVPQANVTAASVTVKAGSACGSLYVNDDDGGLMKYTLPLTNASSPTVLNTAGQNVWVSIDPSNNLYITTYFGAVSEYAPPYTGAATASYSGAGANDPYGTLVDAAGHLFIAEFNASQVIELSSIGGTVINTIAVPANPYALAMDAAGNLYVAVNTGVVEIPPPYTAAATLLYPTPQGAFGVAFTPGGSLVVGAGTSIYVVAKPYGAANLTATITNGVATTFGLSVDCQGNIYSPNYGADTITAYAPPYTAAPYASVPGGLPDGSAVGP